MLNFRPNLSLRLMGVFGALFICSARASLYLTLIDSDGFGNDIGLSIADNGLFDDDPANGAIAFKGKIGDISGNFAGFASNFDGRPSLEFTGNFSNTKYAGFIGYLYFGDFGQLDPGAPFIDDTISIKSSGILNFTHQAFEGSQPQFDWGGLGTTLTDQRGYGGNDYSGFKGTCYSSSSDSFSQLISVAGYDNTATSFETKLVVSVVPENLNTLCILGSVFLGLVAARKKNAF